MSKKIKWKALIVSILIPIGLGIISGISGEASEVFKQLAKPSFSPPAIVFPIVWTILYILMGISAYLIYMSRDKRKSKSALRIYLIQLLLNGLWTTLFFRFRLFLFSFLWLLIIIAFVLAMIIKFYRINKWAAYIQIPYLLWLIFASFLNYEMYLIN